MYLPPGILRWYFFNLPQRFLFPQLISLPEFVNVKRSIGLSERGIQITGQTLNEISELMLQLPYMKKFDRMLHFFRILYIIDRSHPNIPLASKSFMKGRFIPANKKITTIHDFLMINYQNDINLKDLAELVNLAEGSLCRLFKNYVGMSPFEYLNKIRIDFVCKLLMDLDLSITDICFDCGFNNISHFKYNLKIYRNNSITVQKKIYRYKSVNCICQRNEVFSKNVVMIKSKSFCQN